MIVLTDRKPGIAGQYLQPQPYVLAKFVSRRLKRLRPEIRVVICAWKPAESPQDDPAIRGMAIVVAISVVAHAVLALRYPSCTADAPIEDTVQVSHALR